MLQSGGIDSLVNKKADAYRGNPEVLKKRYSQNQELMDLLAMQKLKSEKEIASRDMALQAEKTPSTIAEQYEQQLVSMNKNEMAGQVAGVLKEKQKRTQQKQQAMGIAPQQRPQGIAGQPRPNMKGMAQGGIVGYQKGGDVVEAEKEKMPSGFSKMFGDVADWAKENPAEAVGLGMMFIPGIGWAGNAALKAGTMALKGANVLYKGAKSIDYGKKLAQATNAVRQAPSAAGNLAAKTVTRPSTSAKNVAEGVSKSVGREYSPGRTATTGAAIYGVGKGLGALDQKAAGTQGGLSSAQSSALQTAMTGAPPAGAPATGTPPAGAPATGTAPVGTGTVLAPNTTAPATGGIAATAAPATAEDEAQSMLGIVGLSTEDLNKTVDTSDISQTQVTDRLKDNGVLSALQTSAKADPSKAQQDEITRMSGADKSKGGLDRTGQEAVYNKYLKEKEALDAEMLSDEAVAKRRRASALEGLMVGGTSNSAAAARGRFDRDLAASRQGSILQRLDIEKKRMDNDTKIATAINTEAGLAMGRVYKDRQDALGTLAKLPAEDITAATQQAKLKIDQNHNQIKNKIDALQAISTAQLNKAAGMANNTAELGRALSSLQEVRRKAKEDFYVRISPQVSILRNKQAEGTLTRDEADTLANFEVEVNQILEETGIDDSIDYFNSLLTGKSEPKAGSATAPDPDPRAASANKYIQP